MHAERCRRVGRDQAALGGVLGVHVVDFTSFLPNRETGRPRLESTVRVLARQRGGVVRSSPARDLATVLGRRPRPLGVRVAPSHPLRLAPAGGHRSHFIPRRRVGAPAPRRHARARRASRLDTHACTGTSPVLGSALGHADYAMAHHRLHGRRTRPCARSSPAPASAGQGSHTPVIDRGGAASRVSTTVGASTPHVPATAGWRQPRHLTTWPGGVARGTPQLRAQPCVDRGARGTEPGRARPFHRWPSLAPSAH